MTILAIDTSCDETSVAVTRGRQVLSNVVSSQVRQHRKFGGVVPFLAQRLHKERIDSVAQLALERAGVRWETLDALAVTYGPGLAPALEVGIAWTKLRAGEHGLPGIAVNHMQGHVASVAALPARKDVPLQFPLMACLVSGGHSEFAYFERDLRQAVLVGQTLDDALGEAYDKVAVMLGLGYPGGAALAQLAKEGVADKVSLPAPLETYKDCTLSYSGLKTAVKRLVAANPSMSRQEAADIAASFERRAQEHVVIRLERAIAAFPETKQVVLAGGVAANVALRSRVRALCADVSVALALPPTKRLATDNAAMIGIAAWYLCSVGQPYADLGALERIPYLGLDEVLFTEAHGS